MFWVRKRTGRPAYKLFASAGRASDKLSVAEPIPQSLLAALADLVSWLDEAQVPSMVIGGVAASVLGRPRLTHDVDALAILPEPEWGRLMSAAAGHGIVPRIEDALAFAGRSRVLLMRHVASRIDLDLTFGGLPFERDAVAKSDVHEIGGVRVRLPRVEELIVMKAIAHRPKDIQDIEGLFAAHPNVDIEFARRWIREFSTAMGMPDILEDFEKALTRR